MKKPPYTKDFMKFWFAYPQLKRIVNGKVKWKRIGKSEAAIVWEYLDAEDKAHAMYTVQFEERGDFNLEASHWLSRRRFDDTDMPEPEGEHLPQSMTDSIKRVPGDRVIVNESRNKQIKELLK